MESDAELQRTTYCSERSSKSMNNNDKRWKFRDDIVKESRQAIFMEKRIKLVNELKGSENFSNFPILTSCTDSNISAGNGLQISNGQRNHNHNEIDQPPNLALNQNSNLPNFQEQRINPFNLKGNQAMLPQGKESISDHQVNLDLFRYKMVDQSDNLSQQIKSPKQDNYQPEPQSYQAEYPQLQLHQYSVPQIHNPHRMLEFPELEKHFMSPSYQREGTLRISPYNSPNGNINFTSNGFEYTFLRKHHYSPSELQGFIASQNGNFSFGNQLSPPQISNDFSFGQKFSPSPSSPHINQNGIGIDPFLINPLNNVLPLHINSPDQRYQSNQPNFFASTLLSNQKILQNPHYVNPYFEMMDQNPCGQSSKLILEQTKKKMDEQKINIPEKIQPQYSELEEEEFVSPFAKNKKVPEPYPGNEKEEFCQPMIFSKFVQNKKKNTNQAPLTSVKKEMKISQKPNPENPKIDSAMKKDFPANKQPTSKPRFPLFEKNQQSQVQSPTEKAQRQNDQYKKSLPKQRSVPKASFNPDDKLLKEHKIIKQHRNYFILDKVIGEGSFAKVYLGYDSSTNRKVAVKKLRIKSQKQKYEVKYLKELNHRNVITMYDYFYEDSSENCYLFLELCDENLRENLIKMSKLKSSEKKMLETRIDYIIQLIQGMNALNSKGIVHRDLKFENILVKQNVLKIGDFGLCRKVNKKLQIQSIRCGTPYTMAPQIYFHPKNSHLNPIYTEKSDIFSLSVIFHQLLYNVHPFDLEQRHLKTLSRVDVTQRQEALSEICYKQKIDITWIKEIIDQGLKCVKQRLSWEELIVIFKNRHLRKFQNKINDSPIPKKVQQTQKNERLADPFEQIYHKNQLENSINARKKKDTTNKNEELKEKKDEKDKVQKKIMEDQEKKGKQNIEEKKSAKKQSKKMFNIPEGRKPKYDIIEQSRRLFARSAKEELQQQDLYEGKAKIISFDKHQETKISGASRISDKKVRQQKRKQQKEQVNEMKEMNGQRREIRYDVFRMMAMVLMVVICLSWVGLLGRDLSGLLTV